MNDTVLNIEGIKINQEIHDMQDSPDRQHVIVIKDDYKTELQIIIHYGKIYEIRINGKNCSYKHK